MGQDHTTRPTAKASPACTQSSPRQAPRQRGQYGPLAALALPDHFDVPAERAKFIALASVAATVVVDLGRPVVRVAPRRDGTVAAIVTMPEAAVDEYHARAPRQAKVGRSG